jgi:uncharacterized phiE125 gp8 family phage protein
MTVEITTQPATEPLTVQEVKDFLKVDGNDDDALIEVLIKAAREWAEATTGRSWLSQTAKEYWDKWPLSTVPPYGEWRLGKTPVSSVTSIQYIDENGVTQTWAAANYTADTKSVPARIFPTEDVDYPDLGQYPNAVICTYVVGAAAPASVPATVKVGMLNKIAFWYENREDIPVNESGNHKVRSADAVLFQHRTTLL